MPGDRAGTVRGVLRLRDIVTRVQAESGTRVSPLIEKRFFSFVEFASNSRLFDRVDVVILSTAPPPQAGARLL